MFHLHRNEENSNEEENFGKKKKKSFAFDLLVLFVLPMKVVKIENISIVQHEMKWRNGWIKWV